MDHFVLLYVDSSIYLSFLMKMCMLEVGFFFFKQKTAYEMRISDWSSDVCSSDLTGTLDQFVQQRDQAFATFQAETLGARVFGAQVLFQARSEESRVGKECVSTCRSRWSPSH